MGVVVSILEKLEEYPVRVEIPVAWGEMDSLGHVNNIVYFRYFETARMEYFGRIGVMEVMKETGVGPILGSTECRFRRPLQYPDTVTVGVRATEVGEDRFMTLYRVVSHQQQRVVAEGKGSIVTYDYSAGVKAALPASIRDKITALEGAS